MNQLLSLLIVLPLFFSASTLHAAPQPDPDIINQLIRKAAESTQVNWREDHWEDAKDRKANKEGVVGYVNAMYWNFLAGERLNDDAATKRALSHYQYMVNKWWMPEKGLFDSGYAFLCNTVVATGLAQSLRDAPDVIPSGIKTDMATKLRGIAAYLPTYTTALKNTNDDLRANNQDAFAAYALALTGQMLSDEKITANAMVKFRSVLDCVSGPFWIEGGIDVGYQQVGEPAMMAAADLLWDQLNFEDRKKVSDLSLLGRMVNGFTFEKARSPSRIVKDSRCYGSGLLAHVDQPLLANDVYERIETAVKQGFGNWELYDLSPLGFYGAAIKNFDKLKAIPFISDPISWGGLGTQFMKFDEQRDKNSGMTRAMLSDPTGMLFIAGDYSKFNPKQASKKFGATEPFDERDPGGMRYLALHEHLYVWADAADGLPAITSAHGTTTRQLQDSHAVVGFAASQYQVQQKLTAADGASRQVTQLFVPVQGVLLIVSQAQPGQTLSGLNYTLPVPMVQSQQQGSALVVQQQRLNKDASTALAITSLVGGQPVISSQTAEPYHRAKIQMDQGHVEPPSQLALVNVPMGDGTLSVIALVPQWNEKAWGASKLQAQIKEGVLSVSFTTPEKQQVDVSIATQDTSELAGVTAPVTGQAQIFIHKGGKLTGFAVQGKGLTLDQQTYFTAGEPIGLSGLQVSQGALLEVTGPASINAFWGKQAHSLIDNQQVKLPYQQTQSAGRWWVTP